MPVAPRLAVLVPVPPSQLDRRIGAHALCARHVFSRFLPCSTLRAALPPVPRPSHQRHPLNFSFPLPQEPEPAFGPQLPSRQAQAPEERLQAAMLLVHAASAGEHLVSMAELAQLALHAQEAAACMATLEGAHLPAAERAVLQAATEEERKEAEVGAH